MAQVPISNLGIGQTTANLYTDVAIAGLLYGLDYNLITTLVYRQTDTVTPGMVLCQLADGTGALPSVAYAANTTLTPYGIFVRDATLNMAPNPSFFPPTAPLTAEALSMIQRGSIWAQVTTGQTCTAHGPVHYNGDGTVCDGGIYGPIPHAIFRTAATALQSGSSIVVVEMHSPLAA